jgi:soluble lytic murein transglycosylase-like protein
VNLKLETTEGELAVARIQLDRANQILRYSTRYQIPADLAGSIYDVALSEGIDPGLGYRLVKVESSFDSHAKSSAGALGYTQILPATARYFEPGLSENQLYERDINLRLGFRFLRTLIRQYQGDVELALVAYNRGPARVSEILSQGGDPHNGYARAVLKGAEIGKATSE